jgi:hypothetical protein
LIAALEKMSTFLRSCSALQRQFIRMNATTMLQNAGASNSELQVLEVLLQNARAI